MYGDGDLAESQVFTGGFCNFGYWEEMPTTEDMSARTEASAALYRKLFEHLAGSSGVTGPALEVGAGRGMGSRIGLTEFGLTKVVGVDRSAQQIERLELWQADLVASGKLEGRVGEGEALPAEAGSFDAFYSVEAIQHLTSVSEFVGEAWRVLRPRGRFAVTTFFLRQARHIDDVRRLIPTVASGITRPTAIGEFVLALEDAGFRNLRVQSIGDHVFAGFDRWLAILGNKAEEQDNWGRSWLKCFEANWIDYYIVDADRGD
ncbi:MAG TPA: methyltransferase domain-containing protein [Allosphingosinicella sp.]|jgi:cyclopropane fatty-acyl-phospholipid synthase-like methyltransferase